MLKLFFFLILSQGSISERFCILNLKTIYLIDSTVNDKLNKLFEFLPHKPSPLPTSPPHAPLLFLSLFYINHLRLSNQVKF